MKVIVRAPEPISERSLARLLARLFYGPNYTDQQMAELLVDVRRGIQMQQAASGDRAS